MIGIFGFPPNNKKFMDRGKSILRIMSSSAVQWDGLLCRAAELQSSLGAQNKKLCLMFQSNGISWVQLHTIYNNTINRLNLTPFLVDIILHLKFN